MSEAQERDIDAEERASPLMLLDYLNTVLKADGKLKLYDCSHYANVRNPTLMAIRETGERFFIEVKFVPNGR
jgi:hypothetical protein